MAFPKSIATRRPSEDGRSSDRQPGGRPAPRAALKIRDRQMSDAVLVPPRRKVSFAGLKRSVSAPALAMTVAGLLALPAPALAVDIYWGGGTGNWSDGARWQGGAAPGAADRAYVNEGTVIVDQDTTITRLFLQQTGAMVIANGRTLTSTIGSAVPVTGVGLTVDGTFNSGGALTIGSGTTNPAATALYSVLSGSGVINFNNALPLTGRNVLTVAASGAIAPGAAGAIGTLTVNGNVAFNMNSLYIVHVGQDGQSDRLDVFSSPTTTLPTGTVTINTSARLVLTPLEGVSYQNGWSYTIMTAENGITGNFSATAANRRVIGDFATFNVANTGNALVATISGAGLGYPVQNIVADVSPGGQGTILQETTDPANQQVYFRSGSVYHVDIGENGQSDRITVAGSGGTVTIEDGAKVVVSPLSGIVYAPGWTYTILAANAIEGQFDDPTANGDFASLSLIHGPRSVTLRIDSVPRVDFASMAETDNQRAVAGALNTVAQGTTLYNTMFLIEAGGTPDALDQLSGVVHASTKGALILHNLRARDAIGARLGTAFGLVESGTSPVMSYAPLLEDIFSDFSGSAGWEATNAPVAWASAYGGWGRIAGRDRDLRHHQSRRTVRHRQRFLGRAAGRRRLGIRRGLAGRGDGIGQRAELSARALRRRAVERFQLADRHPLRLPEHRDAALGVDRQHHRQHLHRRAERRLYGRYAAGVRRDVVQRRCRGGGGRALRRLLDHHHAQRSVHRDGRGGGADRVGRVHRCDLRHVRRARLVRVRPWGDRRDGERLDRLAPGVGHGAAHPRQFRRQRGVRGQRHGDARGRPAGGGGRRFAAQPGCGGGRVVERPVRLAGQRELRARQSGLHLLMGRAMRAILAAAVVAAAGSGAAGQGLPGGATSVRETFSDWQLICESAEGNVVCAVSQALRQEASQQLVLAVELIPASAQMAAGTVVMPFGLRLSEGVAMSIDDSSRSGAQPFSTCLPVGCMVPVVFETDAVAALRAGSVLTLSAVVEETGDTLELPVSLQGFAAAYDRALALRPDQG
jgi:invasion protein IalB